MFWTAAAAEAMRRILIENARRKKSIKYGGDRQRVDIEVVEPAIGEPSDDLLALDEALEKLSTEDKVKADLVKLRYFAGLTGKQAAEVLGISHSTADEYWSYTKAWLLIEMKK